MGRRAIAGTKLLLALAAGPATLAGCGQTSTYGTGQMPEVAMFHEITGGLLGGEEKAPIEYQPRAPLVMPPTATALPPPAETASTANANWPVDADEPLLASAAATDDDPRNDVSQAEYRRLRGLAGVLPNNGARRSVIEDESGKTEYYRNIVHGRQQRQAFQQSIADVNGLGRTERRYLTDPPTSFREPAPTAPTEFDAVKKKRKGFLSRMFGAG